MQVKESKKIPEDLRTMETLGVSLLGFVFDSSSLLPILWELSKPIKVLPFIGEVDHALVYVAVIFALFGTALLAAIGIKLPALNLIIKK